MENEVPFAGVIRREPLFMLVVAAVMFGASALAHSAVNAPILDDWAYAWGVEHLLKTGELRVLDFSAHYLVAQTLWGALFGWVFGFSFFVLRISTVVLAVVGMLAFCRTLRLLGVDRLFSAIATLFVFFNPVWFLLTHSFMTDIPFLSVMNLAVLCYVLWAQRGQARYLVMGGVFALAAVLIRQVGAVLPLVPLLYLLVQRLYSRERRAISWLEWVFLLLPFAGVWLTLWLTVQALGGTYNFDKKAEALKSALSIDWWRSAAAWSGYFQGMVVAMVQLGFVLSPLALVSVWGRSRRFVLAAAASLAVVLAMVGLYAWMFQELPTLLASGETLSLDELGGSRPLMHGDLQGRKVSDVVRWALLAVSLSSCAVILALFLEGLRQRMRWITQPGVILLINGILQFLAIEVLWLYYDRYYLAVLPSLVVLLIAAIPRTRIATLVAVLGVIVTGTISITGTIDNFRYSRAVSDGRQWALSQGAAPSDIDAGYALNGWWLYAHPENLKPGANRETDVPFVTGSDQPPYIIANRQIPSYTRVMAFRWRSLWAMSDRIVVLREGKPPAK